MNLVDNVEKAIYCAENNVDSSISPEIFDIEGFCSKKIRIFLNSLVSFSGTKYLEIGSWQGSTLCSALHNNNPDYACAIDNFSQWWMDNNPKDNFIENTRKFIKCQYDFLDTDCFTVNLKFISQLINVYLYDGDHGEKNHYEALNYYYPALENKFVYICDDWNWLEVKIGTYRAIRDLNLQIIKDWQFHTDYNGDTNSWWNGFYVAVLEKVQ